MTKTRVRALHRSVLLALGLGLWSAAGSVLAGSCEVSSGGLAFNVYTDAGYTTV